MGEGVLFVGCGEMVGRVFAGVDDVALFSGEGEGVAVGLGVVGRGVLVGVGRVVAVGVEGFVAVGAGRGVGGTLEGVRGGVGMGVGVGVGVVSRWPVTL